MDSRNRELFDWPDDNRFYLTLDLECDYGTAVERNSYQAVQEVDRLATVLEKMDVPLTCFVQTELLDAAPAGVDRLRELNSVSFHPHSHSHTPRSETDVERELAATTDRYQDFFNERPTGYRFPNGNLRREDYGTLAEYGYRFDAGFFPSWRPNHFNHSDAPTRPHGYPAADIIELPLTVAGGPFRVPTTLSYLRLLGQPFRWLLWNRPPGTVVFNIHMHDLSTPPAYDDLPPFYKAVYGRNTHGFDLLERVIERFQALEYTFGQLDELHEQLRRNASGYSKYPMSSSRSSTESSSDAVSVPLAASGLR